MKNPAVVQQPKLKNPLGKRTLRRSKSNKGNLPYLKRRRQLRKVMF